MQLNNIEQNAENENDGEESEATLNNVAEQMLTQTQTGTLSDSKDALGLDPETVAALGLEDSVCLEAFNGEDLEILRMLQKDADFSFQHFKFDDSL